MMRFDRFTERAQDAANRSIEILQRYGHNQVDTEHILLALLEQPDGVVPQILSKLNVDVDAMRAKLEEILRAVAQGRHLRRRHGTGLHHAAREARAGSGAGRSQPPEGRVHLDRAHLPGDQHRAQHGFGAAAG